MPMKVPVTTPTPASQSPVCASPSEVVSRDSRIPVLESTHPSMGWSLWLLSSRMSFCHHSIQMSLLCKFLDIIAYLEWPWSPVLQVGRLHVFSFCSLAISLSSDKFPHTKETCWYKRCGKPRMPTWCQLKVLQASPLQIAVSPVAVPQGKQTDGQNILPFE